MIHAISIMAQTMAQVYINGKSLTATPKELPLIFCGILQNSTQKSSLLQPLLLFCYIHQFLLENFGNFYHYQFLEIILQYFPIYGKIIL